MVELSSQKRSPSVGADDGQRESKKSRLEDAPPVTEPTEHSISSTTISTLDAAAIPTPSDAPTTAVKSALKPALPVMPPSLEIVTGIRADLRAQKGFVGEEEVGIIGYAGNPEVKGIRGVIKQRFTDFLVYEVGLDGQIMHLKDIGKPVDPYDAARELERKKDAAEKSAASTLVAEKTDNTEEPSTETSGDMPLLSESLTFDPIPLWPVSTTYSLQPIFPENVIIALRGLVEEGRDPPRKVDAGWASVGDRPKHTETTEEEATMNIQISANETAESSRSSGRGRSQGRDRGRGRGGRGGGRGGRGGQDAGWSSAQGDSREVLSQPLVAREDRAVAHKAIRELFKGSLESSSRDIAGEEGSRLVIKWARGQGRRSDHDRKPHIKIPPFIHFALHKSNRDTQDCIGHMARLLNVHVKDFSVCGTKDKRAVTIQRVCFKRGQKNLVAVWKTLNNVRPGRNSEEMVTVERAERGARIGDLAYSSSYLELGMLKGNHFVITLRNVQSESRDDIDRNMSSLRDHGFINFYGMQRFGTSTVPTHITGLDILRSNWSGALDGILSLREGEHPSCTEARLAWLEDQDLEKALRLMPRRCVAERSIWEFWNRGGTRESRLSDKLGALGSIPRNLRTMYVHAYQSYIWNLVVSERIKLSATKPLVGDLVFADKRTEEEINTIGQGKPSWATSSEQDVKHVTEEDVDDYTIFDVIMPLPGWNVEYPEGAIGDLYTKTLQADGLDPHKMRRDQRDYSLPGSYRKIVHLPTLVSWSHVGYTDPDLSLVQSDEDKILGIEPAAEDDPQGKFQALKVELTLGSSAYATMALREITREETASWWQSGLTMAGEDQAHKGSSGEATGDGDKLDGHDEIA